MITIELSNNLFSPDPRDISKQKQGLQEFLNNNSKSDFLNLTHNQKVTNLLKDKFNHIKHFVHIGLGGSSLGTEAILNALHDFHGVEFIYFNNIDPDELSTALKKINPKQTLFYVVSKSGGTHETMLLLSLIDQFLKEKVSEDYNKKNFIATCTQENSFLWDLSKKWDLPVLEFPETLGGRYCVLSNVGYFPASFTNISIDSFIQAQKNFKSDLQYELGDQISKISLILFEYYKNGCHETVLMPYSSKLRSFGDWFVQLWAESLGKRSQDKSFGFTPVLSYGTTGQHSQLQLFIEGPKNKFYLFIEIENSKHSLQIENDLNSEKLKHSTKLEFQKIMNAHLQGVKSALDEQNLPHLTLKIPVLDEFSLAYLMLFMETLTVMMGPLAELDPFNQPGVELSKRLCLEELKKIHR